jgi:hypothetical protein
MREEALILAVICDRRVSTSDQEPGAGQQQERRGDHEVEGRHVMAGDVREE